MGTKQDKICSKCKINEHDGWCDGEKGNYCQGCWEGYADSEWWKVVIELDKMRHEK